MVQSYQLITILGPTAAGKTSLAAGLAAELDGEIISADSRQVYRGMNIGTGKDLENYLVEGKAIPYHLVDVADPGYEYNVYEFQRDFMQAFLEITDRGKKPILCGGTGMYIDSVISAYELNRAPVDQQLRESLESMSDEELIRKLKTYGPLHNTTDLTDRRRTLRAIEIRESDRYQQQVTADLKNLRSINFGLHFERDEIRERITRRLKERLDTGLTEEVSGLLEQGLTADQLDFYGLEYRYVTRFVTGGITYDDMFQQLNSAIHQFAKRQMTWFRRMERKGVRIIWIDGMLPIGEQIAYIRQYF